MSAEVNVGRGCVWIDAQAVAAGTAAVAAWAESCRFEFAALLLFSADPDKAEPC